MWLWLLLVFVLFWRVREGLEGSEPPVNPLDQLTARVQRIEDAKLDERLKTLEDDIKSFADS